PALVINGDFIDFLAERPARHFDAQGAVAKLRRIAGDAAFSPVFAALRRFLGAPGHRLAVVLGNHDLELALPWVRQELQQMLCDDEAAAGRLVWALDGQGVLLRIGDASGPRVLCVHGNEVDAWNAVDHEALRRLGREGLRGWTSDEVYRPNAGSRMVIEVMNDIKHRFPFVDLLKPETAAVIPTLLALDPGAAAALLALPPVVAQRQLTELRMAAGLLGEAIPPEPGMPQAPRASGVGGVVSKAQRQAARRQASMQLLDIAETDLQTGRAAADLLDAAARTDTLGWGSAAWTLITGGDKVDALRAQLKELAQDRSFLLVDPDETYTKMHERVSTNIDYLVTGHTHLARAIEREPRRAFYFNTGTWARVVSIAPETLEDGAAFRLLFEALASGSIEALDNAPGLVPVRPHVAAFWHDAAGTHGELRQVDAAAPYRAVPVIGSRFSRS
ncbi:phosphoesterase, partial [Ramlibacter sp.]|uniref:phosphoesterase n=1 Tax=Ramlibacter sp. TaxID=1917967 RepID=UPI0017DDBF89